MKIKRKLLLKKKRSPAERHTQKKKGSLIETFRQSQMSFSIRRE